ncbi:MAG: SDR family oxidoreductase [Cyclobacteriaceae bacterium]|nr:SDR family oxidoreductase [Cyclobacteriaceae bacterium]
MKTQKVAIITAASRGIGAACAERLAEDGYKLVLMSRSDDLYPLADRLDARPLKGSVTRIDDLERLVGLTYEKYGRIDTVVIGTGHAPKGDLLKLTDADWKEGLDLLLLPVIRLSRRIVPLMKSQRNGTFINISSFGAREPSLDFPVSSVLRAGLSSFTKMFASAHGADNIRMNNVLPGFINTYPADEQTVCSIPLLRQGTPEEVAGLVSYLASDQAAYVTGQDFLIDGGLTKSI